MGEKNSVRTRPKPADEEPSVKRMVSGESRQSARANSKGNHSTWKNERPRLRKLLGLACWLLCIALLISFVSYFFTWSDDQEAVKSLSLVKHGSLPAPVKNWLAVVGAYLGHLFIYKGFGVASFSFVFMLFMAGYRLLFDEHVLPPFKAYGNTLFFLLFVSILAAFSSGFIAGSPQILGGAVGYQTVLYLKSFVGAIGVFFLLAFAAMGWIIYVFNPEFKASWFDLWRNMPASKNEAEAKLDADGPPSSAGTHSEGPVHVFEPGINSPQELVLSVHRPSPVPEPPAAFHRSSSSHALPTIIHDLDSDETTIVPAAGHSTLKSIQTIIPEAGPVLTVERNEFEKKHAEVIEKFGVYDSTLDLSSYVYPELNLLEDHGSTKIQVTAAELEQNKDKIVKTLEDYDIGIDKIKATIGPSVTLYEIIPKAGVRISKIKNLEDDIALNLAALGIRIIAPIPGKGTIGIEVPNLNSEIVSMRSVLNSEKYLRTDMDLPIALGKTIANEVFVADLARMPHLLMAGATGQGKSVGINALLVSLIYKKHPSQLKFVLVDPKKVELTLYRKIERHFLASLPGEEEAIITDTKKVINTLNSLCIEMDLRYTLLKDAGVRNLKEYNQKFINRRLSPEEGHRFLPFIVLVIDEFADLMMTAGKEIETPIARLAQLARAIGIHLVVATQRPSVNIITGTIKANFPARLAFRVTSKIDSRTILDSSGAEQLVGRGDMLLSTGNDLIRLQCAFVDTPEVEKITDFIGAQRGYPTALLLPEYSGDDEDARDRDMDSASLDPLFKDAARLIVLHQQGSTSLIQRKLQLGYNRAGRIIDQLEQAGIVGKFEGSKARAVLYPDEHSLEQYLETLNSAF